MKVICGDMEFGNFIPNAIGQDPSPACLVHKVKAVLVLPDNYDLDLLLTKAGFDSYIVVSGQPEHEIYYGKDAWKEIASDINLEDA